MVSFLSAIPSQCARSFSFIPRLFGCHRSKVLPSAASPTAENLAKRKVQQLTPSLANLAAFASQDLNKFWSQSLDRVMSELLAQPELAKPEHAPIKAELKKVLQKLELPNLELFFEKLAKTEIERPSSKQVSELLDLIDLGKIEACIKSKNPFFNGCRAWASEYAASGFCQEAKQTARATRTHNVVTQFFPNLGYTLRRAFDLFDSSHPPSSLYEYGVLITMYFHFFCLPYILFKALSAVIAAPAMVLLTATLIIGLTVGALYVYLRWIRSCPKQVIFCENLSEKHRNGELHPVTGREDEFRQALACLNPTKQGTTVNLLLIGEPGVGKTEFMNGLAQRLKDREVFKFKNWSLFGAPGAIQSPGDKMETAFREVKGFEQKPVFCCDELGDAKDQVAAFLKPVLNNDSIQFVGSMTKAQYEKLKLEDKAFEERFKPIFLNPTNKEQTIRILKEKIRRSAPDLSYSQKALEKIFELSELRGYCQPRRAITILDQLINRVQQFKIEQYTTPELSAATEALNCLKAHSSGIDSPLCRPLSGECVVFLSQYNQAKKKVEELEREVQMKRSRAAKMQAMLHQERGVKNDIATLVQRLSSNQKVGGKGDAPFSFGQLFYLSPAGQRDPADGFGIKQRFPPLP